jgi:hypothetical protein
METKKEIWIEQTLSSVDDLKHVAISSKLSQRLADIPREFSLLNQRIPMKAVWLAAASIALLLTMNILSVRRVKKQSNTQETSIYSDYFSYTEILE